MGLEAIVAYCGIPATSGKPPSNMFRDAVTHSGSCEELCELCGRTCFEDDEISHDPGRLAELKRLEKKEPDKYVEVEHVRWGDLAGKHVVTTCPCNGLRAYEDFIWANRHIIADYVHKRAQQAAEAAYREEAEAEFLQENLATGDLNRKFAKCAECQGYFDSNLLNDKLFCARCAEVVAERMLIAEREAEERLRAKEMQKILDDDDDFNLPF